MNLFYSLPKVLSVASAIIAAVCLLVVLERVLSPRISSWGDIYPTLLSLLVISSKTVIPLFVLWKFYNLGPGSLGWIQGDVLTALGKGLVLAVIIMIVAGLYQKYSHIIFGAPYVSTGFSALQQVASPAAITILLSASLLNALGEEILFRGMLFPALSSHAGIFLALIIQSFVFTAYHIFPLQNSVLLFIMGIMFGLGYLWSGSLITPVLAHLIGNAAGTILFAVKLIK